MMNKRCSAADLIILQRLVGLALVDCCEGVRGHLVDGGQPVLEAGVILDVLRNHVDPVLQLLKHGGL